MRGADERENREADAELDAAEIHRLIGAFVNQCAGIELCLACWLQKLSSDPDLVALMVGDRDLPMSQQLAKAVRKLAVRRAPVLMSDLDRILKGVEALTPTRNAVAHNPFLISDKDTLIGWPKSRRQGPERAVLKAQDLESGLGASTKILQDLSALYQKHFGTMMEFESWDK